MTGTPELKCFSILLAWIEDDHEAGEYGWHGLAPDFETAVELARSSGANSNNGYTQECENCGCTDQDGSGICPDCGAEGSYVDPADIEGLKPSRFVLDSMEGCNMWAAKDMLAALEAAEGVVANAVDAGKPVEAIHVMIKEAIAKAKGEAP